MTNGVRPFLIGLFCGGFIIASVWAVSVWWQPRHAPDAAALYDACLATKNGNTVACDAYMRVYERAKDQDDALEKTLKEGGAKMLAAGHSKREVVDWARGMGGVGHQLSDAAGISLKELQDGKY